MDTGSRGPAPGGRGRSGWAAARGCAGLWPGCGACPRLGFAARGRCWPPPGSLRGRIYFRRGCRRRRWRGACPGRGGRRGLASLRGLPLAESALRAAATARPSAGRFQRIFGEMFGARHVRQQDAPRVCSSRDGDGASDSRALPEDFRRNVRRTTRPTARRSQRLSGMVRVSHVPQWTTSTGTTPHRMLCLECPTCLDE